jgi:hypothetical protein
LGRRFSAAQMGHRSGETRYNQTLANTENSGGSVLGFRPGQSQIASKPKCNPNAKND